MGLKVMEGVILLFLLILTVPTLWGLKPYTVMSGSMEPVLPIGSVVYILETKEVKAGDLIAFDVAEGQMCIHRCLERKKDGTYVTKGDANDFQDMFTVAEEQIKGRSVYVLPFAGYGMTFLQTPAGIGVISLVFLGRMILDIIIDRCKEI